MTIDDTETVKQRYGDVTLIDSRDVDFVINCHARLKADFKAGDTLYHYSTVSFLAGDFGYLLVRDREIVGRYLVGMS